MKRAGVNPRVNISVMGNISQMPSSWKNRGRINSNGIIIRTGLAIAVIYII
jgi:hypothetical protein